MSEYQRTTRECSLESLSPVLGTAVRHYSHTHELGNLLETALFCGETTATKQKRGFFGRKTETTLTGFLLAPPWLIWAVSKNNEPPAVLAVRLRDIQVQDYEQSEMYKLVPDAGIDISGLRTDAEAVGTAFIGLGPEPAAQKFRELLHQAVKNA
ncbi:MAG: hypothetical protein H6657_31535 [Ardenticatenaceae bacterium]|nr:hypothetical protein [Ardenticatenaceae bacterium]